MDHPTAAYRTISGTEPPRPQPAPAPTPVTYPAQQQSEPAPAPAPVTHPQPESMPGTHRAQPHPGSDGAAPHDIEHSGSLTGDVLAHGGLAGSGPAAPPARTGLRIAWFGLVILAVVAALALFGLLLAGVASDAVSGFFDRVAG